MFPDNASRTTTTNTTKMTAGISRRMRRKSAIRIRPVLAYYEARIRVMRYPQRTKKMSTPMNPPGSPGRAA
jgi:hypothetical protein